jgi:hypothetical protein
MSIFLGEGQILVNCPMSPLLVSAKAVCLEVETGRITSGIESIFSTNIGGVGFRDGFPRDAMRA